MTGLFLHARGAVVQGRSALLTLAAFPPHPTTIQRVHLLVEQFLGRAALSDYQVIILSLFLMKVL